jgi:hypothetical protein
MPQRITDVLLSAFNDSTELRESDWRSIEEVLRGRFDSAEILPKPSKPDVSENRFAATISSGMARIRAGR